ncbi:hypothetical protein JOD45_001704 [Scopulibacillus daqui]|uniref:ABC-2 type transport system permease protein n=1 Tax=Scopulibacillus daqui TaxID=1469162 RepID=A0ABS2PZL4_9BACL|nr:ABC transporter permease [Scopulibacillus daqui]MBM7645493.1 hypothetical protein [Scopulibacillus daqui]
MFISLLRMDFKNVFSSKNFWLCLLVLTLLFFVDLYISVYAPLKIEGFDKEHLGFSLYFWLGTSGSSISTLLFFTIAIISCMPYSIRFLEEKSKGYHIFIVYRSSLKTYFSSKAIVTFISGGLLFTFPFIISFCAAILMFKNKVLEKSFYDNLYLFHHLFPSHGITYMVIYLMIMFSYAGAIAVFGLWISTFVKNIYVAYLAPFFILLILQPFFEIVYPQLSPMYLANPIQPIADVSVFHLVLVPAVMLIISLIGSYKGIKKYVKI